MPKSTLTGSRIRERRIVKGFKQADLARSVGISPAYLNLIEHNRRRIGGKLLVDLARELDTDLIALAEGAQAPVVEGLKSAAADGGPLSDPVELDRAEEFASRFPGWAAMAVQQRERIEALERRIEALNDRLAHDPYLSDALHDLLSSVTAIRSTAGILNTDDEIDPEWRVRFHRNLYEDSQRLADGSQSLVTYLDTIGSAEESLSTPLDEVEAWLEAQDYSLSDLSADRPESVSEARDRAAIPVEPQGDASIEALTMPALNSAAARDVAAKWRDQAYADQLAMPLEMVDDVLSAYGADPSALAREAEQRLEAAMRRFASMPPAEHRPPVGLARCDGSGTLTFRKPLDGFVLPRFGAACPLWPLYQTLLRPMVPLRRVVELQGQTARRFVAYAICTPVGAQVFDAPDVVEATMMFVPKEQAGVGGGALVEAVESLSLGVGSTCRVCAREACAARREPSLVVAAR